MLRTFTVFCVLFLMEISFAQANTWTMVNNDVLTGAGTKTWASIAYDADSARFVSAMGWLWTGSWDTPSRYSELYLKLPDYRWINMFPHDTLVGKWGNLTGNAENGGDGFEFPTWRTVEGYLRPSVFFSTHKTFYQYAFNPDNGCIYYYLANFTSRYNTRTRRWDTLSAGQPTAFAGGTSPIIWGSMCYDGYNHEVLLFGGNDVDAPGGHCGTWTLNTASNTWTKLSLDLEPPARCLSQMAYDADNHCIVLFGGDHMDYQTADTWVYDCVTKTWSEKHPTLSPSPRAGHALVYLPKSGYVALLGGYRNNPANLNDGPSHYSGYQRISPFEMWRYDVAANEWKLIKSFSTGDVKPSWMFQAMAAADTGDRIVVLGDSNMYGGNIKNTYLLTCDASQIDESGTVSAGVAPGTRCNRDYAGDPAWFDSVLASANPDSLTNFYKTMATDTWYKMTPPRNPYGARDWGTRVYDPDHDQLLVWSGGHSAYCGSDVPQYSPFTNRWKIGYAPEFMLELNGDGGNSGNYCNYFTFNNRPWMTGHSYRNYCYSSVHKKLIKHHPSRYTFVYDPVRMDWDTAKIANPGTGTNLHDIGGIYRTSLSNTPHGAFGWIMFMVGECCNSHFEFWLLDSTMAWKPLPVKGDTVVPGYYCEDGNAVYDSKRDRMLIVSSDSVGQVWAYSFTDSTLTKLNPTGNFNSGDGLWRESAYLPAQDKVIYQGNPVHRVYNCETNAWELFTATKSAGVGTLSSNSAGYAYDPGRDLVWIVEDNCEVYVMRVAGGYDVDSLPMAAKVATKVLDAEVFSASPNPFTPSLTIMVSTALKEPVSVKVYDIRGKLVTVLLENAVINGKIKKLNWNNPGGNNSAGIYFLRQTIGSKAVKTIKAIKIN